MFLQRLTQRYSALSMSQMRSKMTMFAVAPQRGYFKDDALMPREQGEYYADPMDVAERIVRLIGLHDSCRDPTAVTLSQPFATLGLNALDMCEVFIGCEREFDLEISEEDCEAMSTVNDLVDFIAKHPSAK